MRYEDEQLTDVDHLNEYVMISLRRVGGIDLRLIEERFGIAERRRIRHSAQPWIDCGALNEVGDWLRIPAEKFLVSDAVIESLFA